MNPRFSAFLRNDNALGLLLALTALAVYWTTLAPSIGFIDAGELAAVAHTFGIAHPTGYPLFTLAAGAFSHLPIGDSIIWRLNLFGTLCTAASVFFFFRFFLALLRLEPVSAKSPPGSGEGASAMQSGAAATGALTLAFSRVFWEQSTSLEVHSLQMLMLSLTLFFFLCALRGSSRAWHLFALCLGMSFANHMTTVLALPGLTWFFFATRGFSRPAWIQIVRGLPAFFAGLSLYLYLPLRAAASPALNWGNPVNLENFLRQVGGKQYSTWMFSSVEAALRQFQLFAHDFPANFGYVALLPMAVGLLSLVLAKKGRHIAAFTALLLLGCLFYAINYDVYDIPPYFLLAHIAAAFWVARGVLTLAAGLRKIAGRGRTRSEPSAGTSAWIPIAIGAACALPSLPLHYRAVDESADYVVEDYARNMFNGLEPGATIVTFQWDYFVAAAYYLQGVEGVRPDVTVLDRELLRRSWYLAQLETNRPELVAACRAEIDAFLRAVQPFERGEAYDGAALQAAFKAMIRALMAHAAAHGPVYCAPEVEPMYLEGYRGVPAGLAFRLYAGDSAPSSAPPEFFVRPFPRDGRLFDMVRRAYASAYVNHAYHQGSLGNIPAVRPLLDKALEIHPGFPQALELMRRMDAGQ